MGLLARRWGLGDVGVVADVGCGVGHWGRVLFPHLGGGGRLVGIDREGEWVGRAREMFREVFPGAVAAGRVEFRTGDVLGLDVAGDSFDVVTCQTLLMHLAEPGRGLAEMIRVTKPGGLVVCVEPSNLFNLTAFDSVAAEQDTETLVRRFEFWLRYQRGRAALGLGDISIGEALPGMFARAGLTDVRVWLRDTAFPVLAPYASAEQRATLESVRAWEDEETGPWNRDQLRRYLLAGGGSEAMLDAQIAALRADADRARDAIARGEYHCAGGAVVYVVSGRKP
ncbi:methyltransferase domain-containing protein [Nocardia sp. NPDC004068]|uniref:methyltransferase domain-containing protein n=1 Tax=Nocardia sp. NPDC004068 TaxID=3364303 RepID=UPI0036B346FB